MLHDFLKRVGIALAYRFYDPGFIHEQRLLFPTLTIMLGAIKTGQNRQYCLVGYRVNVGNQAPKRLAMMSRVPLSPASRTQQMVDRIAF
ncbi:MAG: hypothetical protein PHV74_02315 [Dehalococcoidia bacterium]|nr:hypothetical protein [Dehalococcoidia bacterium]